MKKILIVLFFWFMIASPAQAAEPTEPLQLSSRERFNDSQFTLPDRDWRWLGNKRELRVGVWQPAIPPLSIFDSNNRYEGMLADYIVLVTQSLGVGVQVERFSGREAALHALQKRQIDMVVDPSGKSLLHPHQFAQSVHFIADHPVLVHHKKPDGARFDYLPGMRLAIASWYVDDDWIAHYFPDAVIQHFASDEQAMASVAFQQNDLYLGNLMTATWLLERNFSHYLTLQQVYPERDTGSHFVLRKEDTILREAVNQALLSLPRSQNQVILQQWSEQASLWRVSQHVEFSAAEKKWLARHKQVNVSVNAFYAPFTMIDANGHFYGITADILRLIRLRTGIQFTPVSAHSVDEMDKQLAGKKALFIGAVTHSETRNQAQLFTRPYFSSPFVMIIPEDKRLSDPLPPGTRVAITRKNGLIAELRQRNPGIEIVETANASLAMQMADDGRADVAIHTLFGASYMIERYFKGRLKVAAQAGSEPAAIAFAVSRDQPELQSILNKSLDNISPADINNLIDKWQTRPDVRLDTWELYKTRFWLVFTLAGMISLTSIIWIYYLRREIKARLLAQQTLQSQFEHNETLTQALCDERERAEQANRAKSTFLATMSHEIRTPVSAIIGLLELSVNTAGQPPEKDDPVRVAWESARTLMGLIGDILDMARIESGRLELAPAWVSPTELLPPVVRVFEGLARQKSLRLRCTLSPLLSDPIFIDPLRFRQVVSNLISNAIKFTDSGSVDVKMTIVSECCSHDALLTVRVIDTGRGIAQDDQHDIFDPWVQAQNGQVLSGSGLGLAICAQLVSMMDGKIAMNSQPGRGTEVCFSLPVARGTEQKETTPALDVPTAGEHRHLRILAVDDHPANRLLLRRQLGHLGHLVTEAKDGEEAWAQWNAGVFDVVITDCSMPGMDGLALTRLIRSHQRSAVKLFGLTANASPEERLRCIEAGMDDCLFKPLHLPQLRQLLDSVTRAAPQPSAPELEELLNYEKLQALSNDDPTMLRELLTLTLEANQHDLRQAATFAERKEWSALAKCTHTLSGAAQILGAVRVVQACKALESALRGDDPDQPLLWQAAQAAVIELNHAMVRSLEETECRDNVSY